MLLRPMTENDVPAVAVIEAAAAEVPWSDNQFQSSLSAGDFCTVLEQDGQLFGFTIFSQVLDEASLLNIAVNPAKQGQGYGRLLLEGGLQAAVTRGGSCCFLEVRLSNHRAQSLYRSMGFAVVGQRKAYYQSHNGPEDALVMSREFGDTAA